MVVAFGRPRTLSPGENQVYYPRGYGEQRLLGGIRSVSVQ
jgi:hypothetical protein